MARTRNKDGLTPKKIRHRDTGKEVTHWVRDPNQNTAPKTVSRPKTPALAQTPSSPQAGRGKTEENIERMMGKLRKAQSTQASAPAPSIEVTNIRHPKHPQLRRIRVAPNHPLVKEGFLTAGETGGWVENPENIGESAWVGGSAQVWGNARVLGEGVVEGDAVVKDNATIYGIVGDSARVGGVAEVRGQVWQNAVVEGGWGRTRTFIGPDAQIVGDAYVAGASRVEGSVMVGEDAKIVGQSHVSSQEGSLQLFGSVVVKDSATVYGPGLVEGGQVFDSGPYCATLPENGYRFPSEEW